MSNLITKRFVVRQSLIGKNVTFEFTNKKGDKIIYNHDKVFSIMKSNNKQPNTLQRAKILIRSASTPGACGNV